VRAVRIFARTFVLVSLAFAGANLLQSRFTGLCPLASILKRLGLREAHA